MQTIFCVEDDANIRELVVYALRASGFAAEGFDCTAALYEKLEKGLPSLLLLDVMLPGEDGITALTNLRQNARTAALPIILLTAKNAEYDKVHGLDSGADDYITKPFGVMELISRAKAVLRRVDKTTPDDFLALGAITLDSRRRVVTVDGNEVSLTFKEFELLHYLMQNPGLVLSREKIMAAVWGFDFEGESRTVDMHIKTLRRKLGEAGTQIGTVRGVGYKISGEEA
ncbi:winged helix-turn-helix domain-containing protein [Intestinibacillus sp. Marseille-P6563]|uniref:winged helix-turn-helix domain-containing protein n=1 Tax=Intestinibacillus sp. Marseille-P6563 TaxID=2364792 RepID=UPI000F04CC01|nr:response regulator transcription factor [Intestinibacillus sp. Marseille-P6563]